MTKALAVKSGQYFQIRGVFSALLLSALMLACTPTEDHQSVEPQPSGIDIASKQKWLFLGDSITQAGHYVDYIETRYLLNTENRPAMIDLGLT